MQQNKVDLTQYITKNETLQQVYIDNKKINCQTLVLIHGWPDSMHSFDLLLPKLMENYRVIVPSLKSFGELNNFKEKVSIDLFATDIKQLLDFLQIKQSILVGHSMGSQVAHLLASKYPDYVNKLILIGTGKNFSNTDTSLVVQDVLKELNEMKTEQIPLQYIQDFQGSTINKELTPVWFYEQIIQQSGKANRQQWINGCEAMLNDDHSEILKNITAEKTLLIRGENDELCPKNQYDELLKLIQNSEYLEIKNGNHSPIWDLPEQCVDIIVNFVK